MNKSRLALVMKSKASFRIMSVAVDPKAMRSGIGAQLISELETILRGLGIKPISLSVRKSNRNAIDCYRRIGFTIEMQSERACYFVKPLGVDRKATAETCA